MAKGRIRRVQLWMTPAEFVKIHALLNAHSACDLDLAKIYERANMLLESLKGKGVKFKPKQQSSMEE